MNEQESTMSDLPEFEFRKVHHVMPYITRVLETPAGNALIRLVAHPDGHFRAIFKSTYFTLAEGHTEPSRSQWATLKKKMKRHNRQVFIFKNHGETDCRQAAKNVAADRDYRCLYVDFGFFLE
jgi:hypothetical protein